MNYRFDWYKWYLSKMPSSWFRKTYFCDFSAKFWTFSLFDKKKICFFTISTISKKIFLIALKSSELSQFLDLVSRLYEQTLIMGTFWEVALPAACHWHVPDLSAVATRTYLIFATEVYQCLQLPLRCTRSNLHWRSHCIIVKFGT